MRITRIHVDTPLTPPACALGDNATHYLTRVLRLQIGDEVELFDGSGGVYRARIDEVAKKACTLTLLEPLPERGESPLFSRLGLSLQRGERMDYAIQKATELGVTAIDLVVTERVEVKLDGKRLGNRMTHWQRVMIQAAQQCGRTRIPALAEPRTLGDWIASLPEDGRRLVMDTEGETLQREPHPESVTLITGPEGGLADHELAELEAGGFQRVQLGPRILRSETAPVAALSMAQLLWGDFLQS